MSLVDGVQMAAPMPLQLDVDQAITICAEFSGGAPPKTRIDTHTFTEEVRLHPAATRLVPGSPLERAMLRVVATRDAERVDVYLMVRQRCDGREDIIRTFFYTAQKQTRWEMRSLTPHLEGPGVE